MNNLEEQTLCPDADRCTCRDGRERPGIPLSPDHPAPRRVQREPSSATPYQSQVDVAILESEIDAMQEWIDMLESADYVPPESLALLRRDFNRRGKGGT